MVNNPEDIYNNEELFQPFDFTETNQIIKEKAEFAINWLKNALENNNSAEKFSENEIYTDLKIKELALKTEELSLKTENLSLKAEELYLQGNNIQKTVKQENNELSEKIKNQPISIIQNTVDNLISKQNHLMYVSCNLKLYQLKKLVYKFKKNLYKGEKKEKYKRKYNNIKLLIKEAKILKHHFHKSYK